MQLRVILFGLLALAAGNSFANTTLTPEQAKVVYSLAERPMAAVVGNTCHVRGAVWAYGPRSGVRMTLIDVQTGEVFGALTQANGVYSVSVPYSGKPRVFQERMVDQVFADKAIAAKVHVQDGGAVCDHRLQQTFPVASNGGVK